MIFHSIFLYRIWHKKSEMLKIKKGRKPYLRLASRHCLPTHKTINRPRPYMRDAVLPLVPCARKLAVFEAEQRVKDYAIIFLKLSLYTYRNSFNP